MNKRFIFLIVLLIAVIFDWSGSPCQAQKPITLAIMNFTNRSQNSQWQWVSKGIADMLITDLSHTDKFQIVEREKMQKFLDEMNLSEAGLMDPATAARFGRVAKVTKALFGSYLIEGEFITLEAHVIDIDTQKVERVEWVKGKAKKILDLEKQLVLNIIKNFHLKLTESQLKSLHYKATDSIDAATHFYQGLDAYDKGEYLRALREIRLSIKQDSKYEKALIRLGHVYADLGEYEHAVIAYTALADSIPASTLADDALFWAAKILYKNLSNPENALELADKLIQSYPEGRLPPDTEIVQQLGHYNQAQTPLDAVYVKYSDVPLSSYIRCFKQDIYLHLGDYRAAYKELVSGFDTQHPAFKVDRLDALMMRAYNEAGIELQDDKIKHIVTLDIENPVYEEEYSDPLKRIKDAFVLTEAPKDVFGKKDLIGYRSHLGKKEYYIHNVYIPKENTIWLPKIDRWTDVRDEYVFAAPKGFSISSVDVELKGSQSQKHGIAVFIGEFGSVGYVNGSVLPVGHGEVMDEKHILLASGSKRFTALIAVYGGTRKNKEDRFAYIDRWRIKANLIRDEVKGTLKIKSNSKKIFAYIDPIALDDTGKQYNWQNSPKKKCPCTLSHVPVGKHKIVAFKGDSDIANFLHGEKLEQEVFIEDGKVTEVFFSFSDKIKGKPTLVGWNEWSYVTDNIHDLKQIRIFQDDYGKYWILWTTYNDIWFAASEDSKTWSEKKVFRSPLNTHFKESYFSVIQGEDRRYYMAFASQRGNGNQQGLFFTSSQDMLNWSNPKRLATIASLKCQPSILQSRDGTLHIYFNNGGKINHIFSKDLQDWSEKQIIEGLGKIMEQVIQDRAGKYWMVFTGKGEHWGSELWLSFSNDGKSWNDPILVEPSIIADGVTNNPESNFPTIIENREGDIVLAWNKGYSFPFSRTIDGKHWKPSKADNIITWTKRHPEPPISIMQRKDGMYIMAYVDHNDELWVSFSDDPFIGRR